MTAIRAVTARATAHPRASRPDNSPRHGTASGWRRYTASSGGRAHPDILRAGERRHRHRHAARGGARRLIRARAAAAGAQSGGTKTVLLVDDDGVMREVVRRMLDASGFRVLLASGGEEAIALASSQGPVDLLLADVEMPGMRGTEVAERVRALVPGVGVLFMSGYSEGLLGAQGILGRELDIIEKPFTAPALVGSFVRSSPPAPGRTGRRPRATFQLRTSFLRPVYSDMGFSA